MFSRGTITKIVLGRGDFPRSPLWFLSQALPKLSQARVQARGRRGRTIKSRWEQILARTARSNQEARSAGRRPGEQPESQERGTWSVEGGTWNVERGTWNGHTTQGYRQSPPVFKLVWGPLCGVFVRMGPASLILSVDGVQVSLQSA